jgi:hypothetical protein
MKAIRTVIGAAVLLVGCASAPDQFFKPYTSTDQFNRDYAACKLYAMNLPDRGTDVAGTLNPAGPVGALIQGLRNDDRPKQATRLCMQAKGYTLQGAR